MRSLIFALSCVTFLIVSANLVGAQTPTDPGQLGTYAFATTSVTVSNPGNGHSLATTIYYPSSGSSVNPNGAPYPTLVFSHGFQSQPSNYAGVATHLASWGYIVAVPGFSDSFSGDNLTPRISDVRAVLTFLETQNANNSSLFYQRIDTTRLGVVGHSLGGTASLGVAGQDNRVKSVVALDPASGAGMPFGAAPIQATAAYTHFLSITAPALIVGTPSNSCNGSAEYNTMYADIGAEHKSKQVIANGNHCDFLDPTNSLCYTFCGGGSANPERLTLAKKLTAAWLNYYLHHQADYFTYNYGVKLTEDVQAGRIVTSTFQTAPRGFTATGVSSGIQLSWTLSTYQVITGYNIYRSITSGSYGTLPFVQQGRQSFYLDNQANSGQRYYYILRSRDALGNEHQPSYEVSAIRLQSGAGTCVFLPYIVK